MHDFWAFILYSICFSIFIGLTFFLKKSEKPNTYVIPLKYAHGIHVLGDSSKISIDIAATVQNKFFIGDVIKLVLVPILIFVVILTLYYLFPTFFMHATYIVSIIASVALLGLTFMYGNPYFAILPLLSTLLFIYFYLRIYGRIKFVAKPFRMSVRTMCAGFGIFMAIILLYTCIGMGFSVVSSYTAANDMTRGNRTAIGIFCFFMTTWTYYLIELIAQLAMSAVTAQYLVHDLKGAELVNSSLRIVGFAIGSACFASFMLAIVDTARTLVKDQIAKNEREGGSAGAQIFLMILLAIITMLQNFLEFLTSWAMTVIALKGSKLTVAMKTVLFDIEVGLLSSLIATRLILVLVNIVFIYCFGSILFTSRLFYLNETNVATSPVQVDKKFFDTTFTNGGKIYNVICNPLPVSLTICTLVVLIGFCQLIIKILEMVYLIYCEEPNIIKRRDEAVYESIREESSYKVPKICGCC